MRGEVFRLGVYRALLSLLNRGEWRDGVSCVSSDMVSYRELDMFIQV